MSPPITHGGQGDLFPGDIGPGRDASPDALKAAELVRMARARISCLWEIDRAAVRMLIEAPGVPLRGRCALELARFIQEARKEPAHFWNALAQIAQRRWKAAGLRVSFLRGSPALDLISDAEWRTLPLAPELAALVAQPRPPHGQA